MSAETLEGGTPKSFDSLPYIDLSKYVPEDPAAAENPISYWMNPETDERLVMIDDLAVPMPEKRAIPPELGELVKTWNDDFKDRTLLDEGMVDLLKAMAKGYLTKNIVHVEGPPAASKTYAAEVFASIMEEPFVRENFSPDSRRSQVIGGVAPGTKPELLVSPGELLNLDVVKNNSDALRIATELAKREEEGEIILETAPAQMVILASLTGIDLISNKDIVWQESLVMEAFRHGGIVLLDEPNLVEEKGFWDSVNMLLEMKDTFRIPDNNAPHPTRQRHPNFRVIFASNPPGEQGRKEFSPPVMSRIKTKTVEGLDAKKIERLYHFMMTGDQPDLTINGSTYKGARGVDAPFIHLRDMPGRKVVVKALAQLHMNLEDAVGSKAIFARPHLGGNHAFDLRDIPTMLSEITMLMQSSQVRRRGATLTRSTDWERLLKDAVTSVYIEPLQIDDKQTLRDAVEHNPVWEMLRTQNLPDWAPVVDGAEIDDVGDGRIRYT